MSKDHIRYDLLVQNALKGVVRKVLSDAARDGLPPEHHFYVSFRTDAPGVKVSNRLREKYPEEMTIVLQHQFWELNVTENHFEVGLSFSGIPEKLSSPFDALTGFYDPSVQFGLKFEVKANEDGEADAASAAVTPAASGEAPRAFTPRSVRERIAAETAALADDEAEEALASATADKANAAAEAADEPAVASDKDEAPGQSGAQVVSLDAFRKKT